MDLNGNENKDMNINVNYLASLLSTGVDKEKVGVDNEKALELDNRGCWGLEVVFDVTEAKMSKYLVFMTFHNRIFVVFVFD